MVCLDVGLDDGDDGRGRRLGHREVVVEVRGVRVDDGQRLLACAAEDVRGTARRRMQDLTEDHVFLH